MSGESTECPSELVARPKRESRTLIFLEIILLSLAFPFFDHFGQSRVLLTMFFSVVQILNCIRYWRREKDSSSVEKYPRLSNLFVAVAAVEALIFLMGITIIIVYAWSTFRLLEDL